MLNYKSLICTALLSCALASPAWAKPDVRSILCPKLQMSINDYMQLGNRYLPRATPLSDDQTAALDAGLDAALADCAKENDWSAKQTEMARFFSLSDASLELIDMRFALRGTSRKDIQDHIPELNEAQLASISEEKMAESGALDAFVEILGKNGIRMNYKDPEVLQDLVAVCSFYLVQAQMLSRFSESLEG
jgi:hypothetical protein